MFAWKHGKMDIVNLMNSLSLNEAVDCKDSNFNIFAAKINGEHTDIVYAEGVNNCMVIASQYEKIGTLLRVNVDLPEGNDNISEPVYSVKVLFGSEIPEQEATARYIAEKLDIHKTLMIYLSLKEYSPETVKNLTEAILNVPSRN